VETIKNNIAEHQLVEAHPVDVKEAVHEAAIEESPKDEIVNES
jgi:hypothetical protein